MDSSPLLKTETIYDPINDVTITRFQLHDKIVDMKHPFTVEMAARAIEMITNFFTHTQDNHMELLHDFYGCISDDDG